MGRTSGVSVSFLSSIYCSEFVVAHASTALYRSCSDLHQETVDTNKNRFTEQTFLQQRLNFHFMRHYLEYFSTIARRNQETVGVGPGWGGEWGTRSNLKHTSTSPCARRGLTQLKNYFKSSTDQRKNSRCITLTRAGPKQGEGVETPRCCRKKHRMKPFVRRVLKKG